jgi:hypothetical protein
MQRSCHSLYCYKNVHMNNTGDLFGGMATLSWLSDETLFSLVSRHHFFWGHRRASSTNAALFGHARGGTQHDLPSCIDEFASRTEQRFGNAISVCTDRTLLRYYRKFMDTNAEERTIATLRSPTVANLKYRMGLLTSRFRANHPLKACVACMEVDRDTSGWAYWHLEHQYPGVWICQEHECLLVESDLKASGVERFLWHLPDEGHFRSSLVMSDFDLAPDGRLSRVSQLAIDLIRDQSLPRLDVTKLHRVYHAEIGRRNLLTARGAFRLSEIANQFQAHVRPLRQLPEFAALPATIDEAYRQLSRQLRAPRTGTHPLRHIVMIEWLFGDYARFLERYVEAFSDPEPCQISKPIFEVKSDCSQPGNDKKQALAQMLQVGSTVSAAAAELGIDTATAMVWATKIGVNVPRRPKKLKHNVRDALVARLREGCDKAEVAKTFGISVVTVTHVLRTDIGLHAAWKNARYQAARNAARTSWTTLTASSASMGVKLLRRMQPAAYAWLYRNDRIWLIEHSPARNTHTSTPASSLRWDVRDAELSAAVERASLQLSSSLGKRKLMLWHLYQEIPDLKAKLSALCHLPMTVRAIERALRKRHFSMVKLP